MWLHSSVGTALNGYFAEVESRLMCNRISNMNYFIFITWQGKSERCDWFFRGQDFAIWTVSNGQWKRSSAVYFFFIWKADKFKTSRARVPYNKLLTNLASSSRTGEYWPSIVFVRTSLHSVRIPHIISLLTGRYELNKLTSHRNRGGQWLESR